MKGITDSNSEDLDSATEYELLVTFNFSKSSVSLQENS